MDASPPAENIAKSNPSSKESSFNSFTKHCLPLKKKSVPADFLVAKNSHFEIGKLYSCNISTTFLPTNPVAPTTAY